MGCKAKITVLIPTFNRAQYLQECLDSIFSQTLPAAQIVVVNDGATDHTRRVLGPYMKSVEYFEIAQSGKPAAINYGLKKASGDYLWIFDDDDVALPEALERFVEPLETHPDYGFSYSTFFYTDTREEGGRIGNILSESQIPDLRERGFLIPLLENNFLGGAALFARTSCYAAVGNFDQRLLRSQDYEMAIRIARQFGGIRVAGGATFHYRQHKGMRGSLHDRFIASGRLGKWIEYNQIFFRELYHNLALTEYLPFGQSSGECSRQGLIQRLAIMVSKYLLKEIETDLHELEKFDGTNPFSDQEKAIIRNTCPVWTRCGSDCPEILNLVRRIAVFSPSVRRLREQIVRGILARLRKERDLHLIKNNILCLGRLYFRL